MAKENSTKIKICVSGAAEMGFLGPQDYEIAKDLGREIAKQGAITVSGATTGFPLWSAMGTKEAGGISIGVSPASNETEHVETYRLPIDNMDFIVYTGFGYAGRDLLLVRSSDAVVIGPGRIGTINEFTDAYEDGKVICILRGDWDTDEVLQNLMEKSHRVNDRVFFADTPKEAVSKTIEMVKKLRKEHHEVYVNGDVPMVGGKPATKIL